MKLKRSTKQVQDKTNSSLLTEDSPKKTENVRWSSNCLIVMPNSKFKMYWDFFIIILSIYNAIMIPFIFVYSIELNVFFEILDRFIDIIFVADIVINFRTAYENSKTGKLVTSWSAIAIKYVLNGRFWIDLLASLPLEVIALIPVGSNQNLKILGILKIIRLLRLGRMISFLRTQQKLKFSIKIFQLMFLLLTTVHWAAWIWCFVTSKNESWLPAKDLDSQQTFAYSGDMIYRYLLFYYYSLLTLTGTELIPTTYIELLIAMIIVLSGTILLGIVIGEFTSLLSAITK